MKYLYKLLFFASFLLVAVSVQAQDATTVKISELNTYSSPLVENADVITHPLLGVEVYYEAVVVAYPRNSGLATPDDGDGLNEPGRIHLFVTDINAIADGRDGMSMQLVVAGSEQRTLEGLDRGDVIGVTGTMGNFNNNIQFNASEVVFLGSIALNAEYAELEPLLEPQVISLTDLNKPSELVPDRHTWVAENYSKYAHSYIKVEGLEIIDRTVDEDGRPWFFLSDGNTVIFTSDVSLRFRNDRGTYAFDTVSTENPISFGYNYRRLDESLDGPFTPPAPGSIVDLSGFVGTNTFDPVGFDESATQRTMRIIPWEDGIRWTSDGDSLKFRVTDGIPNDLVVQGFAPIFDNYTVTPDSGVSNTDAVVVSVDVLLPEVDYTLNSVKIAFSSYGYTEDSGDTTTVDMTPSGDTYSYTFATFEDFTNVDFTITATAQTPDEVITTARTSGSFSVESATQTSPVAFSPNPEAIFINSVSVTLSTATEASIIYYTLDGSDATESSTEYTGAFVLEETTTVNAVAIGSGLTLSPVSERTYTVEAEKTQTATLDIIRNGVEGDTYEYTGNAVVIYTQSNRNQKYLMDATGGLLIDDSNGTITSEYAIGDVMTGVIGELGGFNGVSQLIPALDPGAPSTTAEITPIEITLAELDFDVHESALVRVSGVSFVESGSFETGTNYNLTDASLEGDATVLFRTNFFDADYIGEAIPGEVINLTAIVGGFNGDAQLIARSTADLASANSNEDELLPNEFALDQNYPNPFNPSTTIRYSLEAASGVTLEVFDILGRKVATLVNEAQTAGVYNINFDASRLSSGTYIYRIEAGDFTSIRKMMLIK